MINSIFLMIGSLLGVALYRLGFSEGRTGKMSPVFSHPPRRQTSGEFKKMNRLLENIDRYDGSPAGQQPM